MAATPNARIAASGKKTPDEFTQTFTPQRRLPLRYPINSAHPPRINPPEWAKLKPGVSLTLDRTGGQRQNVSERTRSQSRRN